jgi:hypothetical protein
MAKIKNRVVSFDEWGAWIDKVPLEHLEEYKNDDNYLVNPDLSLLKRVPMEYWKRQGDSIVEMTPEEKLVVDERLKTQVGYTPVPLPTQTVYVFKNRMLFNVLSFLIGVAVGVVLL